MSDEAKKRRTLDPSLRQGQVDEGEATEARSREVETTKPIPHQQSAVRNPQSTTTASDDPLARVWEALATVTDPEIPVLNVVEMGIIAGVRLEGERVVIDVTPTFVGCPALDVIRRNIREAVSAACGAVAAVHVVFDPVWTSERISEEGRRKLALFGVAPPHPAETVTELWKARPVRCPHCGSMNTALESPFGPTLCRSIHYCHQCRQSFEHFKPV